MAVILGWGYWGIFLLMVLENVIPPVPSEAIMGMAGIGAARGHFDPVLLVLVGTLGTVVGNLFWWEIGRRLGYERLQPFVARWGRWLTVEWHDVERFKGYFDRWGGPTIFVFRFMPFGRTIISLPAGLMHMPFWKFCLYTAAGSALWNAALVGVGYGLGSAIAEIDRFVTPAIVIGVVAMLIFYIWRVLTWKPRAA
ncbi:membrane protein DedA, SNARE-associated domain [Sphingomonas sp. NFR04]|uniref:DedA family protein n=1 Tax=Sphingomonas sp. NFR04 TaxID=1566283 RepID=UPI0008E7C3D9|nr:DedA family protein [Sphingomonas sp. NFR04]SFK31954.1 membrane protein DedA, SNARE-associated domain [Sphingomonas sp. NFR04]